MSDRHEKWTPVEPGTVIPAGQRYRVEHSDGTAYEGIAGHGLNAGDPKQTNAPYFVDSSWRPPLVLPTEPTWGIVLHRGFQRDEEALRVDQCHLTEHGFFGGYHTEKVLDFIPLTDEQVTRIEAAR